jgi:hypothetical protein
LQKRTPGLFTLVHRDQQPKKTEDIDQSVLMSIWSIRRALANTSLLWGSYTLDFQQLGRGRPPTLRVIVSKHILEDCSSSLVSTPWTDTATKLSVSTSGCSHVDLSSGIQDVLIEQRTKVNSSRAENRRKEPTPLPEGIQPFEWSDDERDPIPPPIEATTRSNSD